MITYRLVLPADDEDETRPYEDDAPVAAGQDGEPHELRFDHEEEDRCNVNDYS